MNLGRFSEALAMWAAHRPVWVLVVLALVLSYTALAGVVMAGIAVTGAF